MTHPRYEEYKKEAFEMSVPKLKREIEKISVEGSSPTSHTDAQLREAQQKAYSDALAERDTENPPGINIPGSPQNRDTPSLSDTYGHGPIPPN
jgi:hypothetical protein